jgi:carnitine O-acetyltransferase
LSAKNEHVYKSILDSVLCLSLDNYTLSGATRNDQHDYINSPTEVDAHLSNLRAGHNASNRWFDKTATIIVESNTRAGAMGEHSPLDALVPSIVAEYGVVAGIDREAFEDDASNFSALSHRSTGWDRLDWDTDHKITQECTQAINRAEKLISNSDHSVLWFEGYGADWIKIVGELKSP